MWMFIKLIPAKVWGYVAIISMVMVAFAKAYQAGMDKQQVRGMKESLNAAARRNKIETNIATLSHDDVDRSLLDNGWLK